jgi:hypothetical protein
MKNLWVGFIASAAFATSVTADAGLTLGGGVLRDSAGNAAADGGLLLLVASTTDTSFTSFLDASTTTAVGSFLNGSGDDLIVGRFSVDSSTSFIFGGYFASLNVNLSANLTAGDSLQLYWFPTLTLSSTTLGSGTSYGQYRTDSTASGSDTGWFMPSDGATVTLNFLTQSSGFGSESDALGVASLTTIPEPGATMAILGAVAGGFVMLRHRRQSRRVAKQNSDTTALA